MMNQLLKSSPPKRRLTTGMIRSLTSESTILPNAAPMITPTARSTTLPLTANSRNSLMIDILPPCLRCDGRGSDRCFAGLAGANAHDLLDRSDEDFPVADLSRSRRFDDRFDGALDQIVGDDHLDLDLGQEIYDVLRTAVELGMALLAAETLNLRHREPADADIGERFAHLVELERLDDGFDFFHCRSFVSSGAPQRRLHHSTERN